jgi:hypothetical protein
MAGQALAPIAFLASRLKNTIMIKGQPPGPPPPPPPRPGSDIISGSYIEFRPMPPRPKTKVWLVCPKEGGSIGQVSWYGPWRKYCFLPAINTVFEQICLREIADFCQSQTEDHHRSNKARMEQKAQS